MTKEHSHILAVKLLSTFALAFLQFYLARNLGVEGFGTYSFVISLSLVLVAFTAWGLDKYTIKFVSVNLGEGRSVCLNYYSRILKVIALNILLTAPVGIYISYRSLENAFDALTAVSLLLLMITGASSLILSSVVKGTGKVIKSEFYYNFIRPFIVAAGAVSIVLLNGHISAIQALYLMVFAQLFIAMLMGYKVVRNARNVISNTKHDGNSLYRSGVPFLMMGLGLPYLANIDIIMIGLFDTDSSVGMYSIAYKLVGFALMGLVSANLLIMPKIAHLHNKGEMVEIQRIVRQNNTFILAVTTPVVVALIFYAETILRYIDPVYISATPIIHILLIGQAINILTGPVNLICAMTGQEKIAAKIMIGMCIMQTMLCGLLIPTHGIYGAAISNVVVNIIFNLSLMYVVKHKLKIDPSVFSVFRNTTGGTHA